MYRRRCAPWVLFGAAVPVAGVILAAAAVLVGGPFPRQPTPAPAQPTKEPDRRADDLDRLRPKVRLGAVPRIALGPREPVTKEKATRIRAMIARLADIDGPDFGLSATMSGEAFLPLPGRRQGGAMILTDHRLKSSAALKDLVELGPDALPFLLDALGDATPTKYTVTHHGGFGAMWLANELWANPGNAAEVKALTPPKGDAKAAQNETHIQSYTVKVGDACLVAVGQITGRGYQAVRYQPSACVVVNSPTADAVLREQVRRAWAAGDPARKLLDSLLLDYATEGVFQGPSLDSWGLGSHLQIEAAMRLLFYYPKETAALIADRLAKLDVKRTSRHSNWSPATSQELDAYTRRAVANGVRAEDFLKAVAWCPEPRVRAAVRAVFTRTDDTDILLAALPGLGDADRPLVRDRLRAFLDAVPADEHGAYGDGYRLLVALADRLGEGAAPAFDRYLKDASPQRGQSAAEALKSVRADWGVPILVRLLDDRRPTDGYTYAVRPPRDDPSRPIRVCDAAAEALHEYRPEWKFVLEGEYKDLDDQIRAIRDQAAGRRR